MVGRGGLAAPTCPTIGGENAEELGKEEEKREAFTSPRHAHPRVEVGGARPPGPTFLSDRFADDGYEALAPFFR